MSAFPVAFLKTGLVTSVGLSAPATCAALRAKVNNPSETRFKGTDGQWILAHQVALEKPWRGLPKLVKMASMAVEEALQDVPKSQWSSVPLLLCVAEPGRPGRLDGLDDQLFLDIQAEMGVQFASRSAVVAYGRAGVAVAVNQARALISTGNVNRVLIAATDSLITWGTLNYYQREARLLTAENSDGFMPGEGAGALLMGKSEGVPGELVCTGIGFARETANLDSGEPLRAEGLSQAMKAALAEAGWRPSEKCFRIADLSGEQYYFKEASLALSRAMRERKEDFELWHPSECIGEAGTVSAIACIIAGHAAATKRYAPEPTTIYHFSNDDGARAVVLTRAK